VDQTHEQLLLNPVNTAATGGQRGERGGWRDHPAQAHAISQSDRTCLWFFALNGQNSNFARGCRWFIRCGDVQNESGAEQSEEEDSDWDWSGEES